MEWIFLWIDVAGVSFLSAVEFGVEKALDAGDDYKAASYIEQAAKEMGGTFRF